MLSFLFEHDLFRKPMTTLETSPRASFRDHALSRHHFDFAVDAGGDLEVALAVVFLQAHLRLPGGVSGVMTTGQG